MERKSARHHRVSRDLAQGHPLDSRARENDHSPMHTGGLHARVHDTLSGLHPLQLFSSTTATVAALWHTVKRMATH
jgi:hypothetical protein